MGISKEDQVLRFTAAAERLLRRASVPKLALEEQSIVFLGGPPLDDLGYISLCDLTKLTSVDLVYFAFEHGRENMGPSSVSVFTERYGVVCAWRHCSLWSPANKGPLVIIPRDFQNVCIGYDGLALSLIRFERSVGEGITRARVRLRVAERLITEKQLARVRYDTN